MKEEVRGRKISIVLFGVLRYSGVLHILASRYFEYYQNSDRELTWVLHGIRQDCEKPQALRRSLLFLFWHLLGRRELDLTILDDML